MQLDRDWWCNITRVRKQWMDESPIGFPYPRQAKFSPESCREGRISTEQVTSEAAMNNE